MTHYIPSFTRSNGGKREAACGTWILPREHSAEPDCQTCAEWLTQDIAATEPEAEVLGYELRDGLLVPKETDVR